MRPEFRNPRILLAYLGERGGKVELTPQGTKFHIPDEHRTEEIEQALVTLRGFFDKLGKLTLDLMGDLRESPSPRTVEILKGTLALWQELTVPNWTFLLLDPQTGALTTLRLELDGDLLLGATDDGEITLFAAEDNQLKIWTQEERQPS